MSNRTVLLLNGPNLSRLGQRKTDIYGTWTLEKIEELAAEKLSSFNLELKAFQSNSEAALIDYLEAHYGTFGLIFNPGALMMSAWSLRDTIEEYPGISVEVHISNLWARESFRSRSVFSPIVDGVVVGCGAIGYLMAIDRIVADFEYG